MAKQLTTTSLHKNPFALLGATTRDNRARILQLAEEKFLQGNEEEIRKAQSELINPRMRLIAELSWLPGVAPNKAQQLLMDLAGNPDFSVQSLKLPAIALLNVTSAAFENMRPDASPDVIGGLIRQTGDLLDSFSTSDLMRDINEDRAVAGFTETRSEEQIEEEFAERKRHYRNTIKGALDQQAPAVIVEIMTAVVIGATANGETHAPEFIDDLVDSYALEAQDFLEKERDNVVALLEAIQKSASAGEAAIKALLLNVEEVTRNWDRVAQPVQLSFKARGIRHEPSRELAYAIRDVAIELYNKHDFAVSSQQLMGLLMELFSELPDVLEKVEEDTEALAELLDDRREAEADQAEWAREIKYAADLGIISKTRLSVSIDGASWGNQSFPLKTITRVRWGGISHSVNGIPTGTTFTIAFGDTRSEAVVELRNKDVFAAFTERLWRAVGIQIMTRMVNAVRSGGGLQIGDAILRDDGLTLVRQKFFGAPEAVKCMWSDVQVWSADGSFFIGATHDKKARVQLSYINSYNTHAIETLIRAAFKKPGLQRLSDLF